MLTYADGTIVSATFVNDEIKGDAIIKYKNGVTYEGPVVSRRLRHGHGKLTGADGATVEADFDNDKRL